MSNYEPKPNEVLTKTARRKHNGEYINSGQTVVSINIPTDQLDRLFSVIQEQASANGVKLTINMNRHDGKQFDSSQLFVDGVKSREEALALREQATTSGGGFAKPAATPRQFVSAGNVLRKTIS